MHVRWASRTASRGRRILSMDVNQCSRAHIDRTYLDGGFGTSYNGSNATEEGLGQRLNKVCVMQEEQRYRRLSLVD